LNRKILGTIQQSNKKIRHESVRLFWKHKSRFYQKQLLGKALPKWLKIS